VERDTSTEGPVTLSLATVEDSLSGKEYERRLVSSLSRLLGYQYLEWLIEHQDEYTLPSEEYVDFPGLVVVGENSNRGVPSCDRSGKRWGVDWSWLGGHFAQNERVAVSSK
jgi:hypothetical protein